MQSRHVGYIRYWVMGVAVMVVLLSLGGVEGLGGVVKAQETFRITSVSPTPPNVVRAGQWTSVQVGLENQSDQDQLLGVQVTTQEANSQTAEARVWMPAQSRRKINLPLWIDERFETSQTLALIATAKDEQTGTQVTSEGQSLLMNQQRATVVLMPSEGAELAGQLPANAREAYGLGRRIRYGRVDQLSGSHHAIAGADVIWQLGDFDTFQNDQWDVVQQWIRSGGTYVTMVNASDLDAVAFGMGGHWDVTLHNEVAYQNIETQWRKRGPVKDEVITVTEFMGDPVSCVIVEPGEFEVLATVNDQPMVLRKFIGQGQWVVLLSDASPWLDPRWEKPLSSLASAIYTNPEAAEVLTVPDGVAADYLSKQVGYEVASKTTVGVILGVYCFALAVCGWWFVKRKQGGGYALVAMVLGVGFALTLVGIGLSARSETPETKARLQWVQVIDGQYVLNEQVALYSPTGQAVELMGNDGAIRPVVSGASVLQARMRLAWLDAQQWKVSNQALNSGTTRIWSSHQQLKQIAKQAGIGFDKDGVQVEAYIDERNIVKAGWLMTREGVMPLEVEQVLPDRVLMRTSADQSVVATQLSVTGWVDPLAQASAELISKLAEQRGALGETMLVLQTVPADTDKDAMGMWVESEAEAFENRQATTFWMMPTAMSGYGTDQAVTIPWPLMKMKPLRETFGLRRSPIWRPDEHDFIESSNQGGAFFAEFVLPGDMQMQLLESAELVLDMQAIGRDVQLYTVADGKPKPLTKLTSPDGRQRIRLDPIELPRAPSGGYILGFEVMNSSKSGTPTAQSMQMSQLWSIEQMALEISGKMQ